MKGRAFAPALLDIAMVWHHEQELFTYLCTVDSIFRVDSSEIPLVIRTCEIFNCFFLGVLGFFCPLYYEGTHKCLGDSMTCLEELWSCVCLYIADNPEDNNVLY